MDRTDPVFRARCDYVVHGLGCPKTGGLVVLSDLVASLSADKKLKVWVSAEVPDRSWGEGIRKTVSKRIANGSWRVLWEFWFGVAISKYYSGTTINVSNYGFSVGGTTVLMIHSPEILLVGFAERNLASRVKEILLRWTLCMADCVLLQTTHMKRSLYAYGVRTRMRVPPVLRFLPRVTDRKSVPCVHFEPFRLFYPASDFPHKRIDLCEGLASRKELKGCHIAVTNSTFTTEQFQGLGTIPHREVISRFSASHALLFTSELETLGLPLLEALSFGLPAVLPRLPYAVEIYGDAACYFESFELESITDAILTLKRNYTEYSRRAEARRSRLVSQGEDGIRNLVEVLSLSFGTVV